MGKNMILEDELLKIPEVARLARVTRQTVYRWMDEGLIKYYELPSGIRRIRVKDAAKALNMSPDEIIKKTELDTKIAKLDN